MNTEKVNILPTFRRALSAISRMKLSNVKVRLEITLTDKSNKNDFSILAFNYSSDNTTFYFYGFKSQEEIDRRLIMAIDAIKTDDFDQIKKISKEAMF